MADYAIKARSTKPLDFYLDYMEMNQHDRDMPITDVELERCKLYVLEQMVTLKTDHAESIKALWADASAREQDLISLERQIDAKEQLYQNTKQELDVAKEENLQFPEKVRMDNILIILPLAAITVVSFWLPLRALGSEAVS